MGRWWGTWAEGRLSRGNIAGMMKRLPFLFSFLPSVPARRWVLGVLIAGLAGAAGAAKPVPGHAAQAKSKPAAAKTAKAPASCPPLPAPFSNELFSRAAEHAADRGFLWKITKGDHSSYLYGSFHAGKAEWMAPGPMVREALEATDVTGIEINPLDPDIQREMATVTQGVKRRLPPELQQRLKTRWLADCLPEAALGSAPPEIQALSLTFLAGRRDGLQPSFGTEILLALLARETQRPVVSLESASGQLAVLLGSNDAEAANLVNRTLSEIERGQTRRLLNRVGQIWEQGDFEALEHYADWCDCLQTALDRSQMKKLMEDRNPALADRVDGLHAEGRRVFAAVGSLHMVGPAGLPALLAQRGYQVERLR